MARLIEAALEAYFDRALDRPFETGSADCCLFGADWVLEWTGRDPAAAWRGYFGDRAAARLMRRHGGVLGLARTGFASAGLIAAVRPRIGSVGVLPVLTETGARAEAIGIHDGTHWATRGRGGLMFGQAEPVAVWGVD